MTAFLKAKTMYVEAPELGIGHSFESLRKLPSTPLILENVQIVSPTVIATLFKSPSFKHFCVHFCGD